MQMPGPHPRPMESEPLSGAWGSVYVNNISGWFLNTAKVEESKRGYRQSSGEQEWMREKSWNLNHFVNNFIKVWKEGPTWDVRTELYFATYFLLPFSPFPFLGSGTRFYLLLPGHILFLACLHLGTFTLLPVALPSPAAQTAIPQSRGHPKSLRPWLPAVPPECYGNTISFLCDGISKLWKHSNLHWETDTQWCHLLAQSFLSSRLPTGQNRTRPSVYHLSHHPAVWHPGSSRAFHLQPSATGHPRGTVLFSSSLKLRLSLSPVQPSLYYKVLNFPW